MPTHLHPGVYIEEIPSGVKTIEGVATSTAAFVGRARRGPVQQAVLIHSLDDYEREFGPLADEGDAMGFAVRAFYQNGGRDAYVARLVGASAVAAATTVAGQDTTPADAAVIRIEASSPGAWGNAIFFRVKKPAASDLRFTLEIGHLDRDGKLVVDEIFPEVSMNAAAPDFVVTAVKDSSKLVAVSLAPAAEDPANVLQGRLAGEELDNRADLFFDANGIQQTGMSMAVSLDGRGAKRITLPDRGTNPGQLDLKGRSNTADGEKVAAAIKEAVRALGPTHNPFKDFDCTYANRKLFLTSGSKSLSSSVAVLPGDGTPKDLAKLLKLAPGFATKSLHGSAKVIPKEDLGPEPAKQGRPLPGGGDDPPAASDYQTFFATKLVKVRDVNFLVLPGQAMPATGGNPILAAAVAHCEDTRNRMLILDVAESLDLRTPADVTNVDLPTSSTYTVLYYPWVTIANPFFNPDVDPNGRRTLTVAPSGFAAAMWAKIDGRRGVWKAPAGVETQLLGVAGLKVAVDDAEQDFLNPLGVNALRKLNGFGHVIWGARTLATKADPEWRYVPVRRTALFIEQSIFDGIQFAVFEPNDHRLWSTLRANIDAFMNGLFRAGAFQGEKVSDAYFVRCGLGDTMTQADIDRGQVIAIVGFAPLKPAEFVIVRIQQKAGQQ